MRRIGAIAVITVGLATATATGQPSPEDVEEAHRLFDEGVAAADLGDYRFAFRAFAAAQALDPQPDTLYNIGMCLRALGDPAGATNAFRDYLIAKSGRLPAEEVAEIDAILAELIPQVGRIVFDVSEPGARVLVDDALVGTSPVVGWFAAAPGLHRVEIGKEGFEPFSSEVWVEAGQSARVDASLVPRPPLPAPPPPAPAPGEAAAGEPERPLSPWFWACVGLAGVSAVTMAVAGSLTLEYRADFNASGRTDAGARDTAFALRTTTDVFLGLGIAAVIGGTVLFFVRPAAEQAEGDAAVTVGLGPSGLVLRW